MKLTREEAIQKTREMWSWIAWQTEKQKKPVSKASYLAYATDGEEPENLCYLCEYTKKYSNFWGFVEVDCAACPLDFGTKGEYACERLESPYKKWRIQVEFEGKEGWQEAAKYARRIANLQEREV